MEKYLHDWVHELLFGAIIGNIAALISIFKYGKKFWQDVEAILNQHTEMWEDFQYREELREKREQINIEKHIKKHQSGQHRFTRSDKDEED